MHHRFGFVSAITAFCFALFALSVGIFSGLQTPSADENFRCPNYPYGDPFNYTTQTGLYKSSQLTNQVVQGQRIATITLDSLLIPLAEIRINAKQDLYDAFIASGVQRGYKVSFCIRLRESYAFGFQVDPPPTPRPITGPILRFPLEAPLSNYGIPGCPNNPAYNPEKKNAYMNRFQGAYIMWDTNGGQLTPDWQFFAPEVDQALRAPHRQLLHMNEGSVETITLYRYPENGDQPEGAFYRIRCAEIGPPQVVSIPTYSPLPIPTPTPSPTSTVTSVPSPTPTLLLFSPTPNPTTRVTNRPSPSASGGIIILRQPSQEDQNVETVSPQRTGILSPIRNFISRTTNSITGQTEDEQLAPSPEETAQLLDPNRSFLTQLFSRDQSPSSEITQGGEEKPQKKSGFVQIMKNFFGTIGQLFE